MLQSFAEVAFVRCAHRHCVGCPVGAAGQIGGYVVFGSSMDYLYAMLNVSYSLTFEIFGGRGSPFDCFP
jgi:hypothetical protein